MAQRSTTTPAVVPFTPNVENPTMAMGPMGATRDPNPPQSLAQVMGATRDPNPPATQATVQYGGPQITATPEGSYGGGIAGLIHQIAGAFSPAAFLQNKQMGMGPAAVTKSAAKVSAKNPGGGGSGAIGSVADPTLMDPNALALQMFFTQTIAPYLDSIRASMGENADLTKSAYAQIMPNVNPALQPYFNADRQSAQVRTLADALAASTAAAPSLDQLMGQISAAQDAQRYAAYQAMRAQATEGLGGIAGQLLGGMAGGDGDPLGLKKAAEEAGKKK